MESNSSKGENKSNPLSLENVRGVIEHLLKELDQYREKSETEANIKNNLYAFILNQGLFKELTDYERSTNMGSPDGHLRALKLIAMQLPESSN
ncbi:MAG: hypothetical protein AB2L24_11615 [Mangrovibacterium sp.]